MIFGKGGAAQVIRRIWIVFLATAGFAGVSWAHEGPTPADRAASATETRQAVFKLLRFNMGPIAGMARGKVEFDAALAERNARRMAALAPMIPDLFATMDTREFDVQTLALPIIWDNMDEFAGNASKLAEAAAGFADVAAGGDKAATMSAFRSVGSACGNCHDRFRADD